MKLNKSEREQVRLMCGGCCAYCGEPLGAKWHADHVEPVVRRSKYVRGVGLVRTSECDWPERHRVDNFLPACVPCNLYKGVYSVDQFRRNLEDSINVLSRNQPTYRHARRFGLVVEQPA
ncbi:MAG: HNH endonuclease, partial [Rubrivivax sp.]